MYSSHAVKNVLKNHLALDKSFKRNGDNYTVLNSENIEITVHLNFNTIQIYKGKNSHPTWIYMLRAENQKELELQVQDYLKFIKEYTS